MFYHAALLFDYKEFAGEARPLADAVNQNNLTLLHAQANVLAETIQQGSYSLLDYGDPLHIPRPLDDVQSSPYKNSFIGDWFMIILSQYVKPHPNHIGYDWRILETVLEEFKWNREDINLLFHGLPFGTLVASGDADNYSDKLTHSDPYWMWIRPDYSYGRGGWLSTEECRRLRVALLQIRSEIEQYQVKREHLEDHHKKQWKKRVQNAYQSALEMLGRAIGEDKGLFLVVLWQWEDEEE
jgi:hypothetical protein